GMLRYFDGVKKKYLSTLKPHEIRVTVDPSNRATVKFMGFPGGGFSKLIDTNTNTVLQSPGGHKIKIYVGGRDDAFFNDLPGFFRSINYAPQFYHVPHTMPEARELPIPKTFLELEGNDLFNFNPKIPDHGQGVKLDLPPGPWNLTPKAFKKDANGNFRFVYSGKDAQAGKNINAVIVEIPLAYIPESPNAHRIVNTWGESWVRKAADKVETIPDEPFWVERPLDLADLVQLDDELR